MKNLLPVMLVFLCLSCGTTRHADDQHAASTYNSDAAEIYAAWVNLTLVKTPQKLVLVLDHSATPRPEYAPTSDMFKGISINGRKLMVEASTVAAFQAANRNPKTLSDDWSFAVPHRILPTQELSAIFAQTDGWKAFNVRFPDSHGYFSFSCVGFNTEKTEALLYIAEHAGWLEGGGRYVLFWKRDGKWQYVAEQGTWVS